MLLKLKGLERMYNLQEESFDHEHQQKSYMFLEGIDLFSP